MIIAVALDNADITADATTDDPAIIPEPSPLIKAIPAEMNIPCLLVTIETTFDKAVMTATVTDADPIIIPILRPLIIANPADINITALPLIAITTEFIIVLKAVIIRKLPDVTVKAIVDIIIDIAVTAVVLSIVKQFAEDDTDVTSVDIEAEATGPIDCSAITTL